MYVLIRTAFQLLIALLLYDDRGFEYPQGYQVSEIYTNTAILFFMTLYANKKLTKLIS
jgi:hypothetical protein